MNGLQRFLEKTWWLVLLVILGGMVYAALGLPRLRIDSDVGTFLERESAKVTAYYEAREEWGTDEFAVFCISAENWFTPEGIATIEAVEMNPEVLEIGVDLRPAFADNLPRIRRIGGRVYANGLYRHGYLLAPAMARGVADLVLDNKHSEMVDEDRA